VVLEHHADLPTQERDLRGSNNSWWFWNTTPICRRRNGICALLIWPRSCPASMSLPLVGRSMASNKRSKVLLPAPEWPVTNRNSPRRARKLSSCKPT